MKKSLLLLIVLGAFTLAGCVPPPEGNDNSNTNENTNQVADSDSVDSEGTDGDDDAMMEEDGDSMMEEDGEAMTDGGAEDGFTAYQNKAVGYSVKRPQNWYWRHYIKGEIESSNPNVDDFLMISREPIGSLGTEVPAPIVVEVSQQPLSTFADSVSELASTSVTVAGESATRYNGNRNGMRAIEYQFTHNGRTFRVIYTAPEGLSEQEAVFEEFVKSFTFTS